jgi:DNA invertase Pin-like site-specific DNA recombinase
MTFLQDLVEFLSELHVLRTTCYCISRARTTTPGALFQMMGVFAEFERSIIQERVRR